MKIDPYKHQEKFLNWKQKTKDGIPEISKTNSDIILKYISDMENGLNVSSKSVKGPRSYIRLNNLRQRMTFLAKNIEQYYGVNLPDISEEQIIKFFNAMRNGTIKRIDGTCYQSVVDFVKPFKAFCPSHIKVTRHKALKTTDKTEDSDASNPTPRCDCSAHHKAIK